ncbi:16S rRNA (uracil(1498)-N(3))-methyltransferase [bacterium]|nr:16S rRNA (uracil(1498)-N(3))-methyltransferase [bacterium]
MKEIYIASLDNYITDSEITLSDLYFVNYIKNVLRFKDGDSLILKNDYAKYKTVFEKYSKNRIFFSIIDKEINPTLKNEKKIILSPSLIKLERFEWLIEKAVELGVDEIQPIITERTTIKNDEISKKNDRWDKIIFKAMTQSFRDSAPKILPIQNIKDLSLNGTVIVLHTSEKKLTFSNKILENREFPITIIVGPEGGFDNSEIEMFENRGYIIAALNFPILRAETASIVALTLVKSML